MRKLNTILTALLLTAGCFIASAQNEDPAFDKYATGFQEGNTFISAGYGFGNFGLGVLRSLVKTSSSLTDVKFKTKGPFHAKISHAVTNDIEIGVNFAYANYSVDWDNTVNTTDYNTKLTWETWSALLRVNYHFGGDDKLDPYLGVGFGYRNSDYKFTYEDPNNTKNESYTSPLHFGFEATLGARYFPIPNLGIYAEVGFAKSIGQIGLTARF